MRLHNFFRSPSASSFSHETLLETPSPPAKKPRHRMEDTLRQMVRTGQLSLDGKKLSLTSDEVPRLQQEVAKQYGRMGGRPLKLLDHREFRKEVVCFLPY